MKNSTLEQRQQVKALIPDGGSSPIFLGEKLGQTTMYIAGTSADIGSLGELIKDGLIKKTGRTNFPDGTLLPKGFTLAPFAGLMVFDTATGAGVTVETANYKDKAPINFKNGELSFTQKGNGGGTLYNIPMFELINDKASTGNDDDFHEFTPFFLREESRFGIIADIVGGIPANVAWKLFLRCDIYGSTQTN